MFADNNLNSACAKTKKDREEMGKLGKKERSCLLYTSDAADD